MVTAEQVQTIVKAIFKHRFPNVRLASVHVQMGADAGDNRIIEIKCILDLPDDFDRARLSVVPRETIAKLVEADDPGFPVMSFIKKSEWGDMKAAAH